MQAEDSTQLPIPIRALARLPDGPCVCSGSPRGSRREGRLSGGRAASGEALPQAGAGEEALDLVEVDVGILGAVDRGSGYPPLRTGQAGR